MEPLTATATSLAQYGTTGVMIALIILVGFIAYLFWRFAVNQIEKSNNVFLTVTKALVENTGAVSELKGVIHDLVLRK